MQIIYNATLLQDPSQTLADLILAPRTKSLRKSTHRALHAASELEKSPFTYMLKYHSCDLPNASRRTRRHSMCPVSFTRVILFFFLSLSATKQSSSRTYATTTTQTASVQLRRSTRHTAQDRRTASTNTKHPIAETRLYTSLPGSLLFAAGLR
jgi:hypothetical protein